MHRNLKLASRSIEHKLANESSLLASHDFNNFSHQHALQPQTKMLVSEIQEHIKQVYGNHWLLFFQDAISILDIAKLLSCDISNAMQQADDIKAETKAWALGIEDKDTAAVSKHAKSSKGKTIHNGR